MPNASNAASAIACTSSADETSQRTPDGFAAYALDQADRLAGVRDVADHELCAVVR